MVLPSPNSLRWDLGRVCTQPAKQACFHTCILFLDCGLILQTNPIFFAMTNIFYRLSEYTRVAPGPGVFNQKSKNKFFLISALLRSQLKRMIFALNLIQKGNLKKQNQKTFRSHPKAKTLKWKPQVKSRKWQPPNWWKENGQHMLLRRMMRKRMIFDIFLFQFSAL